MLSAEARGSREVFERAVSAAPFCLELWEAFAGEVVEEASRGEGGGGVVAGKGGGRGGGDKRRGSKKIEDARRCACCVESCVKFVCVDGNSSSSPPVLRKKDQSLSKTPDALLPARARLSMEAGRTYSRQDRHKQWGGWDAR